MNDALIRRANEILDDIEEVVDFHIEDVDSNPELIDIIIRGRLKSDLSSQNKKDPAQDYDRAMKGLPLVDTDAKQIKNKG
ncbi:hypothetical protein LCGC14_1482610 [marine sediment metagenome]|uniref:Uncharacterized protein n=1 Tax=marine sediment metagenome TaxID=412755 RepID=A0A0F9MAY8_9ZZZZ